MLIGDLPVTAINEALVLTTMPKNEISLDSKRFARLLCEGSRTSKHELRWVAALAFAIGALATPAYPDQCSGRLTAEHGELVLTTENGGVCIIGKADERKVRARCSIGRSCVVTGAVDLCKDAADCVEITRATHAHSGH